MGRKLGKVEKGEMDAKEFSKLMVDYVLKSINDIKSSSMATVFNSNSSEVLGTCPRNVERL